MRFVAGLVVLIDFGFSTSAQAPNLSKPIAQRGMPVRVHVFEDYETDIEKRWWLAGKVVTKWRESPFSVPNRRACRATETKDFDRANGDQTKLYKAVIFNPVPGPPMGPRTRLSFRYWLKGTDELRVQIYSLSKNYHRFLTLKDLPQEKWQVATVDMTQARKPDGTGGPLAEDERIDDIQFYIDREADLFIDDIVLYEEAAADEWRPFPKRIIFTGWFDTGQQGKEWPGDFTIVKHEKPRTWKAAKSVATPDGKETWIRLHLRGLRHLSKKCEIRFRYHVTGAEEMRLVLVNTKEKRERIAQFWGLKQSEWTEAMVPWTFGQEDFADELRFLLPRGAELLIDDVLIYEPGKSSE